MIEHPIGTAGDDDIKNGGSIRNEKSRICHHTKWAAMALLFGDKRPYHML